MIHKAQTHSAGLLFCKGLNGYKAQRLNGSFQQVDKVTGECYTMDAEGKYWEVI